MKMRRPLWHSWTLLLIALQLPRLGEGENLHRRNADNVVVPASSRRNNNNNNPYFRGHGQTYRIKAGEAVTLACVVENLGSSVIVWKQTNRIISAGERLIRKDPRMKLIREASGISLRISQVQPDDAGNYICELETYGEPMDQTNRLDVLVPPTISIVNGGGNKLSVRKDSTVSLACNATGFPEPRITWQREYQMLPTGEKEKEGSMLVLQNVTRLDSGVFICTAANGVDTAVDAKIELKVVYEPEIQVEKAWVHADIDVEVKISCVVYAEPEAEVRWYRETMLLAQNENRLMRSFGVRHSLLVHKAAGPDDFGNYSCTAENRLGKARAFIEVSGQPHKANITSRNVSFNSDRYNLTWTVFSYSEISRYRILYRKVILTGMGNTPQSLSPLQSGSYTFYALEPNSQYEVVVQGQNRWGWSHNSDPFFFSTRATDFSPKVDASQPKGSRTGDDYSSDDLLFPKGVSSSSSSSSSAAASSANSILNVHLKSATTFATTMLLLLLLHLVK